MGDLLGAASRTGDDMSIRVDRVERVAAAAIAGWHLDGPAIGKRADSDALEIDGWVIGRTSPVVAIEATVDGQRRSMIPVERERPDVLAHFPPAAGVAPGFRGWVPVGGAAGEFAVMLHALTADGAMHPLGVVHGTVDASPAEVVGEFGEWDGPDFLIIGAQRSGSTSLFRYLATHPQITGSIEKEVKYFTAFAAYPWSWYRSQFPSEIRAGTVVGEATPYYLPHPLAPGRVAARLPRAKLIAILRNPVDRALSHYHHERARGTEWLSFEEALAAESERLRGAFERLEHEPGYASIEYQNHSYATRGLYAEQVRRWLAVMPARDLLVVRSEDLYAHPLSTVNEVAAFLGVDAVRSIDAVAHNERPYAGMSAETRARLAERFAGANRDLEQLLGRDMHWD